MAIENYPDTICGVATSTWTKISNTQTFTSPFGKSTQTVGLTGSLWASQLNYPILELEDYDILNAFMIGLRGMAGRFYLSPMQYQPETAHPTGLTATVAGTQITLSAPAPNLKVGDYISINHELKMVIIANSTTLFTVDQPFRETYTSQPIELNKPDCLMMLSSDNYMMEFRPPLIQSVTVECVEAVTV